jgi:hypothetical protein
MSTYVRKPTWAKELESRMALPKTPRKIVAITIEENGDLTFLKTDSADVFLEMGETVTRRASHVEPDAFWPRQAFRILRTICGDKNMIAAWTRNWSCMWRVNTRPVGGPVLPGRWRNRQEAIDNEIVFLNTWFLERGQEI